MKLLGALLALCSIGVCPAALAEYAQPVTVTIRFIDARNGKPYTYNKHPVEIFLLRRDPAQRFNSPAEARANLVATVRQLPDANGEVRFPLPTPTPTMIDIPAYLTGCGPGLFNTKEVLDKGVVGKNGCRTQFARKNVKLEAKPGEIIYFVAPLSFWERVNHAIFF